MDTDRLNGIMTGAFAKTADDASDTAVAEALRSRIGELYGAQPQPYQYGALPAAQQQQLLERDTQLQNWFNNGATQAGAFTLGGGAAGAGLGALVGGREGALVGGAMGALAMFVAQALFHDDSENALMQAWKWISDRARRGVLNHEVRQMVGQNPGLAANVMNQTAAGAGGAAPTPGSANEASTSSPADARADLALGARAARQGGPSTGGRQGPAAPQPTGTPSGAAAGAAAAGVQQGRASGSFATQAAGQLDEAAQSRRSSTSDIANSLRDALAPAAGSRRPPAE